ncbi:carboxylesterase/lipase family protein [Lactobacillus sp. CBA3605]|uniref:carboxylesterase family protein n=1 Tax=Lactobacillus sp. CBA3605 TaxID=2099788 RepID=UPI000CFDD4FB|nr:carboxylesterase family protein [Lactobacillus sp. CBA3605]AVK61756.1 carboxylesterase/lipase family protein [Lactobacillus sp. CBA3605]
MSKVNQKFPNVQEWLGVRYGKAERFQKAEMVQFDTAEDHTKTGPAAVQFTEPKFLTSDKGESEDCLNLNIWAPTEQQEKLPVVVYIHGGGWTYGANSQDTSDLSGLVASGKVIGVSVNYRLGPLGWLELSQYGGKFKDASNLGLQDLVLALKWIQQNISQFGGDPSQVTLTGHSAGSFMLMTLLAVPEADGLYHKLAAFSGYAARYIPAWWAEELADKVLKELQFTSVDQLLTVDNDCLFKTVNKLLPTDILDRANLNTNSIGIVDDEFLPNGILKAHPADVIRSGEHKAIDLLMTSTTAEASWYVANRADNIDPKTINAVIDEMVYGCHIPRQQAELIAAHCGAGKDKPVEVRAQFYTDYNFTLPALREVHDHAAAGGRAYQLSVGPVEGSPAYHGTDMYGIVGQAAPNGSEEQLARDHFTAEALLNFATNQHDNLWPAAKADQVIIKDIGQRPYVGVDHAKEVLALFKGITRP